MPPLGSNQLLEWYRHPSHGRGASDTVHRFPKLLRKKLQCPSRIDPFREYVPVLGYGIHLKEGISWPKFFITGFIGFVLSAVYGILWSVYKHDMADGFQVASYIGIFFTFTMGFIQAAITAI